MLPKHKNSDLIPSQPSSDDFNDRVFSGNFLNHNESQDSGKKIQEKESLLNAFGNLFLKRQSVKNPFIDKEGQGEKQFGKKSVKSDDDNKNNNDKDDDDDDGDDQQSKNEGFLIRSNCLQNSEIKYISQEIKDYIVENKVQSNVPQTVDQADEIGDLDGFLLDNITDQNESNDQQVLHQAEEKSLISKNSESFLLIRTKGNLSELEEEKIKRKKIFLAEKAQREEDQKQFEQNLDEYLLVKDQNSELHGDQKNAQKPSNINEIADKLGDDNLQSLSSGINQDIEGQKTNKFPSSKTYSQNSLKTMISGQIHKQDVNKSPDLVMYSSKPPLVLKNQNDVLFNKSIKKKSRFFNQTINNKRSVPKIRNPFTTGDNQRVLKKKNSISLDYGPGPKISQNSFFHDERRKSSILKASSPLKTKQSSPKLKIPKMKSTHCQQRNSLEAYEKSRYDHYLSSTPKNYKFQSIINPNAKTINSNHFSPTLINNKPRKIIKKQADKAYSNTLSVYKKPNEKQLTLRNKSISQTEPDLPAKVNNKSQRDYYNKRQERKSLHAIKTPPTINIQPVPKDNDIVGISKEYLQTGLSKTIQNSPKLINKKKLSMRRSSISSDEKPMNSARSQKRQESLPLNDGSAYKSSFLLPPTLKTKKQRTHSFNSRKTPIKSIEKTPDWQCTQRQSFDCLSVYFPYDKFKTNSKIKKTRQVAKKNISEPHRDSRKKLHNNQPVENSPSHKNQIYFHNALFPSSNKGGKLNITEQRILVKQSQNKFQKKHLQDIKKASPNEQTPSKFRGQLQLHTQQAEEMKKSIKHDIEFLSSLNSPSYKINSKKSKIKASSIIQRQQGKHTKNGMSITLKQNQQKLINPFRQENLFKSLPRKPGKVTLNSKLFLPSSSSSTNQKQQIIGKNNNIKLPKIESGRVQQLVLPRLYSQSQSKKKKVRENIHSSDGEQESK